MILQLPGVPPRCTCLTRLSRRRDQHSPVWRAPFSNYSITHGAHRSKHSVCFQVHSCKVRRKFKLVSRRTSGNVMFADDLAHSRRHRVQQTVGHPVPKARKNPDAPGSVRVVNLMKFASVSGLFLELGVDHIVSASGWHAEPPLLDLNLSRPPCADAEPRLPTCRCR
jgi:hypothetical protein